jgi:NAD(P)-dependent dehydrogenase (short-subunit alcohol dehydrogenase family)
MSPVAVVTGAARGIGAATVDRLVADDWQVVAVDVCADDPSLDYLAGHTGRPGRARPASRAEGAHDGR